MPGGLVDEYLLEHTRPFGAVATRLVFKDGPELPKADCAGRHFGKVDRESVGDMLLHEERHNDKSPRFQQIGRASCRERV